MSKLFQIPQHSNCNCCGRQAPFKELARRASGYGPLNPPTTQKRPNTHHGSIQPLERRVSERIGSANQRRKSLQHGSESTQETSVQKTFDALSSENNAKEIAMGIEEAIVERSMLQATESRMKGTSRDKESLLEECLALKEALCDQLYHLQLHRVHHVTIDGEQRKMEITIQELEMAHGLQAPRTGDPSQLKARILGLKCRQQEYYNIMTIQQNDIEILKKDTRVSFTKEASMERDVFAGETRRLQKMIRRLRVIYHKVCSENNEVVRLRDSIAKLQTKITKIEMSIKNSKSIIEQMKKDIVQAKLDSIETQKNAKNAISKAEELETHSLVLRNMLVHEKEEAIRIQKQTSTLGEQIRIVKKENSDSAVQAALRAGMLASDAKKEKRGKNVGKMGKLKEYDTDDSTSGTSKDLSAVRSSPSSPATPSSQSSVNKDFDKLGADYIKAIGEATNTFVETAPRSKSPGTRDLGSPTGDHSEYEQLHETFQKNVFDAENSFMDMMDEPEYGAARPRKDLEAEAKRLREQLEAIQKQQMDIDKWLNNLTIKLDNKTLNIGEYVIDVKDSKTNVKITSPDKTPEALARKKAEEEARRKREAEEAARRAAEEEARRKQSIEEEEARRKQSIEEEEARRKQSIEEEARRKQSIEEEEARRKQSIEEEAARRRAAEEEAQKKREAEEAARRAAEEVEAQKKREAEEATRRAAAEEEETRRKKHIEEEAARRAAEEEAKRKRDADEEAARKRKREAEDEAKRKRDADEDAARKKKREAEDEAKRKRDAEDEEAARKKREAEEATTSEGKAQDNFFTEEMQGSIKENIKEVLGHLEVISKSVQQKASPSGSGTTAESAASDVLKKLD